MYSDSQANSKEVSDLSLVMRTLSLPESLLGLQADNSRIDRGEFRDHNSTNG